MNAIVVTLIFWKRAPHGASLVWLGALCALAGARIYASLTFSRRAPAPRESRRWARGFAIGSALTGLGWGSAALVFYPHAALAHQVFLVFVVGGMAAGAASSNAIYGPAFIAYTAPALLPFVAQLLREGDPLHWAMAGMTALFGAASGLIARSGGRAIREATRLRLENEAALHQLSRSREQLALVVEGGADGYWDWDLRTGVIIRSQRYGEMLGLRSDDISPDRAGWEQLLHPDDATAAKAAVDAHLAGQTERYEAEYRLRTHEGSWKWVRSRGRVVERDTEGRPLRVAGTLSDVDAQRREGEHQLREARFAGLVHRANEIELVLRLDGSLVDANDRAVETYGYPRDELLRRNIRDLGAPGTLPLVADQMEQAHRGALPFETQHRRSDGTVFPVEVSSRAFAAGGERYLHSLIRDLTERRLAENALRESEEQHRIALDAALLGTWRHDLAADAFHLDERARSHFGFETAVHTLSEVLGRVHPDDAARVTAAVTAALVQTTGAGRCSSEHRVRVGDAVRWLSIHAQIRFEGEGTRRHAVVAIGTSQDITERKRTEEWLRRLAAAVEQTPASIVITDPGGTIEYVNPTFEQVTGFTAAEVVGQSPRLWKSGRQDAEFYRRLWATIGAGSVWHGRLVNRTKQGNLLTEDVVIAPVRDDAGVIRNYVAVKRDISQELALERQLFGAQKLESVARLAGGIAHDFNNVLTVILSCADALRRDLADGAPEAQEEVEEVRVAAERARDLTRQLLAFARRQVIEPVPLDLNALLLKNERLLRRLLTEDIALRIAVAPAVGTILCDPSQMEQILLNLAVNARDAMPKGGELTIEAANLDVTEAYAALYPGIRPGPHVRLAVHDTGAGMPPEVLEHIFEPFFTTKELGRGTGLGLATVYGIVRQSDGFVRVESAMGHGTTFEMLFPRVAQAPQAETQFPQLPESLHGSETVLVVEDEPQVRIVSARALRSAGYRVIEAASGLEALNALASHGGAVHLVVTDGVMPGMNGRELIEAIRPKWPRVRVLMVSGHAHDVLEQRNLLEDGLALLEKPFTLPMLLKKVRVVLDGQ